MPSPDYRYQTYVLVACSGGSAEAADQLMEWCTAGRAGQNGNTRHLRLVIDSCYAGLSPARMMMHPTHWTKAVIRDALAACLPSQEAFELPSVGHSVLTYTRLCPYANEKPPSDASTEEHRRWMDEGYPHWSAARRETTQYLTNGRQHALDLINGHAIGLASNAGRSVDVADWPEKIELDKLVVALDHLPRSGRPYKW
jgi:hypothetical protein